MAMKIFDGTFNNYNYDTSLFYRNDKTTIGADPGVLWVSPQDDSKFGGYYYCVVTGGEVNDGTKVTGAYTCYRSRDLHSWEVCGAVNGYALQINPTDWCMQDFWAPEYYHEKIVVNGEVKNRYYLYFNALSKQGDGTKEYSSSPIEEMRFNRFYLGIAVSDSPCGPFTLVDTSTYYDFYGENRKENRNGNVVDNTTPPFNFYKYNPEIKAEYDKRGIKADYWPAIDITPFLDPATGEFYCYFSHHPSKYSYDLYIWVVKMKDLITPDYSTMHVVALAGYSVNTTDFKLYVNNAITDYTKVSEYKDKITRFHFDGSECAVGINEGANVLAYFDSATQKWLYYLTYSPFGMTEREYAVLQAVSTSPFGPFKKLPVKQGLVVLGILNQLTPNSLGCGKLDYKKTSDLSSSIDFMAGTGHHTFAKRDGEIFAVYHSFPNPLNNYDKKGFMGRRISTDKVFWTYSPTLTYNYLIGESGNSPLPVLYANGPTYSLQPLPVGVSGYADCTSNAKITVSGKHSKSEYLSDGKFVNHTNYMQREFTALGEQVLTFEFDNPMPLRAIMVYNSCDYSCALKSLRKVELFLENGQIVTAENITQNKENAIEHKGVIRYGSSIILDFEEQLISKVKIYICPQDKFDTSTDTIKLGSVVMLARVGKKSSICNGNSFGVLPKIVGEVIEKTYTINTSTICVKRVKGDNGEKIAVCYNGQVYHADDNGNFGKFEGLERWYKNTAILVKDEFSFAEVSAFSIRANGANANIIESAQEKIVAEFYFNNALSCKTIELTLSTSATDFSPKKYQIVLE